MLCRTVSHKKTGLSNVNVYKNSIFFKSRLSSNILNILNETGSVIYLIPVTLTHQHHRRNLEPFSFLRSAWSLFKVGTN